MQPVPPLPACSRPEREQSSPGQHFDNHTYWAELEQHNDDVHDIEMHDRDIHHRPRVHHAG